MLVMHVIFQNISTSRCGCPSTELEASKCQSLIPCLIRSRGPSGEPVVRVGVPLVDDYLESVEGRCRPNTALAAAYDLRVFFSVVAKPPADDGHRSRN
jgi:hypothetical protein